MNRILLISASHYLPDLKVARVERYWTSALTLVHLAALTPPDFQVDLVDDFRTEPPLDTDAGLVGITAMGLQIGRAYALADAYRARGRTVVLGGEWVSLNPDQALEHCDAIVQGEAEDAWPGLLADHRWGGLRRRVYREYYFQFPLYVTRGCPFRCEYCCITQFHGGTFRTRPIGEVLDDLDAIRALGSRNVLFMDDNPVADRDYARELFRAMTPKGMRWSSPGVPLAKFHLPIPYPGTPFFDRMEKEGRILTRDWNRYHYGSAVIRPMRMTPEMAETKFWATYEEFFSLRSIVRRFFPPAPRRLGQQMHYLTANLVFRKLRREGRHPYLY